MRLSLLLLLQWYLQHHGPSCHPLQWHELLQPSYNWFSFLCLVSICILHIVTSVSFRNSSQVMWLSCLNHLRRERSNPSHDLVGFPWSSPFLSPTDSPSSCFSWHFSFFSSWESLHHVVLSPGLGGSFSKYTHMHKWTVLQENPPLRPHSRSWFPCARLPVLFFLHSMYHDL